MASSDQPDDPLAHSTDVFAEFDRLGERHVRAQLAWGQWGRPRWNTLKRELARAWLETRDQRRRRWSGIVQVGSVGAACIAALAGLWAASIASAQLTDARQPYVTVQGQGGSSIIDLRLTNVGAGPATSLTATVVHVDAADSTKVTRKHHVFANELPPGVTYHIETAAPDDPGRTEYLVLRVGYSDASGDHTGAMRPVIFRARGPYELVLEVEAEELSRVLSWSTVRDSLEAGSGE